MKYKKICENWICQIKVILAFNPFRPEFTIVILIHYKPRIDVAITDL